MTDDQIRLEFLAGSLEGAARRLRMEPTQERLRDVRDQITKVAGALTADHINAVEDDGWAYWYRLPSDPEVRALVVCTAVINGEAAAMSPMDLDYPVEDGKWDHLERAVR